MSENSLKIDTEWLWERYKNDPIWTTRGRAIDSYALLERALCELMATIAEIPQATAAAFFYKITAYRTRLDIMELLLKRTHGDKYADFWRSFCTHVSAIDNTRNAVVHWHSQTWMKTRYEHQIRLSKGDFWSSDENTPYLTTESIEEFREKCEDFILFCHIFIGVLNPPADIHPEQLRSWQEICRQPITHPQTLAPPPGKTARRRESPPPTSSE